MERERLGAADRRRERWRECGIKETTPLFLLLLEVKNKIIKVFFFCSPILTFGEWY